MSRISERAKEFEVQVAAILQFRGYNVRRDVTVDGTQIDLIAEARDSLNDLEYIVECCSSEKPVDIALIKQKAGVLLDSHQRRRLLYVSLAGFTREARDFAKSKPVVLLVTLHELERELLDLEPYIQWFVTQYERSEGIFSEGRLFDTYIPLDCTDSSGKTFPLSDAIHQWMQDSASGLLFLLGEYGRGKTSFCRYFCYSICKAIQAGMAVSLGSIPVLINLRDYRYSQSIEQIITDTLLNRYGVRIASFGHFQRFCSTGRIILVLDGFDEMAESAESSQVKQCFQQLYTLSLLGTKIIVTCRTNYFRSNHDLVNLLDSFSIRLSDIVGHPSTPAELSLKGFAHIIEICPLSKQQVFAFLQKRFGDAAETVLDQLRTIHDLSDLSRRPVLLDMICETLPYLLKEGKPITSASLYECYTKRWTRRDSRRTALPDETRQNFCEALAWFCHITDKDALDYELLHDSVALGFQGAFESQNQLDSFIYDIQTCSFLVRLREETAFRFAHKSFREFFVARRLISELVRGHCPSRIDVDNFVAARKKRDEEDRARTEAEREWLSYSPIDHFPIDPIINTNSNYMKELFVQMSHDIVTRELRIVDAEDKLTLTICPPLNHGETLSMVASKFGLMPDDVGIRVSSTFANFIAPHVGSRVNHLVSSTDFVYRIKRLFRETRSQDSLVDLHLTPEIATFAIEIAGTINIAEFITGLVEEPRKNAFLSLLTLGPAQHFVEIHLSELIAVITKGQAETWWANEISPLLAEYAPRLADEQIEAIANKLTGDVLARFMLGLIKSPHDYRSAFAVSFSQRDLTTFEKMLVRYGGLHPTVQKEEQFVETLILDLIQDRTANGCLIVEDLVEAYAVTTINHVLKECIRNTDDAKWKKWLVSICKRISNRWQPEPKDAIGRVRAKQRTLREQHDREAKLALNDRGKAKDKTLRERHDREAKLALRRIGR